MRVFQQTVAQTTAWHIGVKDDAAWNARLADGCSAGSNAPCKLFTMCKDESEANARNR